MVGPGEERSAVTPFNSSRKAVWAGALMAPSQRLRVKGLGGLGERTLCPGYLVDVEPLMVEAMQSSQHSLGRPLCLVGNMAQSSCDTGDDLGQIRLTFPLFLLSARGDRSHYSQCFCTWLRICYLPGMSVWLSPSVVKVWLSLTILYLSLWEAFSESWQDASWDKGPCCQAWVWSLGRP